MIEQIGTILQSVAGVIGASGIISGLILRRIDRLEKKLDAREHDRVEESIARGEALAAVGKLSEANTLALRVLTSEDACQNELLAHREAATSLERFMRSKSAEYLHANS